MVDGDSSYEVGYGKPPRSGQFAKERSGNPKGRSKGSKNLALVALRESRQKVLMKGPHGSKKMTKLEAAIMQLGNKSAQGDLRAQRQFFQLIQRSEESMNTNAPPLTLQEMDKQVMENIRRRMQDFQSSSKEFTTEVPE